MSIRVPGSIRAIRVAAPGRAVAAAPSPGALMSEVTVTAVGSPPLPSCQRLGEGRCLGSGRTPVHGPASPTAGPSPGGGDSDGRHADECADQPRHGDARVVPEDHPSQATAKAPATSRRCRFRAPGAGWPPPSPSPLARRPEGAPVLPGAAAASGSDPFPRRRPVVNRFRDSANGLLHSDSTLRGVHSNSALP